MIIFLFNILVLAATKFRLLKSMTWAQVLVSTFSTLSFVPLSGAPCSSIHGIFQAVVVSGLPFPPPEDLLEPRIESASPLSLVLQAGSLPAEHQGSPPSLPFRNT